MNQKRKKLVNGLQNKKLLLFQHWYENETAGHRLGENRCKTFIMHGTLEF